MGKYFYVQQGECIIPIEIKSGNNNYIERNVLNNILSKLK